MRSSFEILVVSSDPVLRRHMADILGSLGIDPVMMETLPECQEILERNCVGLVFCDAHILDGSYQDLLARYSQTGNPPRVVITSRALNWDEYQKAMRSGAFDIMRWVPAPSAGPRA